MARWEEETNLSWMFWRPAVLERNSARICRRESTAEQCCPWCRRWLRRFSNNSSRFSNSHKRLCRHGSVYASINAIAKAASCEILLSVLCCEVVFVPMGRFLNGVSGGLERSHIGKCGVLEYLDKVECVWSWSKPISGGCRDWEGAEAKRPRVHHAC